MLLGGCFLADRDDSLAIGSSVPCASVSSCGGFGIGAGSGGDDSGALSDSPFFPSGSFRIEARI